MHHKKKLIEVALPLDAINAASVRESYIYRGNPSAVHKWWAQRPLAAARAVIFAQFVDDPSSLPDEFPSLVSQEKERRRLFQVIERLVQWESTNDERVLEEARAEILKSWRRTQSNDRDRPESDTGSDQDLPPFRDPFAGGGTLPLEAQRLGFEVHASDLNPVAVLINKGVLEFPVTFAGRPPVNPSAQEEIHRAGGWHGKGPDGIVADLRYYASRWADSAEQRLVHMYPRIGVSPELAQGRPELSELVGQELRPIAWLWARTVRSPDPAFREVAVPLMSTFQLSTKKGREVHLEPVVRDREYRFVVKSGEGGNVTRSEVREGTRLATGANFRCLLSGAPITPDYIQEEAKAGRLGARLVAIVVDSDRGRFYLPATKTHEEAASLTPSSWTPDVEFFQKALGFRVGNYGMSRWRDLFTGRQLVALSTFADLIGDVRTLVRSEALAAGNHDDGVRLSEGGASATAYADCIATYLAFVISKVADYNCALVPWYTKEDRPGHLFSKQAIPMVWDYAELNPLSDVGGSLRASSRIVADALLGCPMSSPRRASVQQLDAMSSALPFRCVISTDPPYYDNVGYADLSDFFYVWLRRSLRGVFPELFDTISTPKSQELVATPDRHGGKGGAEAFFLAGMNDAIRNLSQQAHHAFPVTIYYAFKQSESSNDGTASTGWETFLDAVIRSGFSICGTWPMRTERSARSRGINSNALASSVVLVCRPADPRATNTTRRDFVGALRAELPAALQAMQRGNVAPVDLAQAAIGPGMAVFTRYAKVLEAEGRPLSVRQALTLINETLDEVLSEQEGDFDGDSRWALGWFDQYGFVEGPYGVAEVLSKAKGTSVEGMVTSGILVSRAGKVRLLRPDELPADWDPEDDRRTNIWEMLHHLIRVLEHGGEAAAALLLAKFGSKADIVRELAYRLYSACERRKRAKEAGSYNGLVQSWPEIVHLASEKPTASVEQGGLFDQE